MKIVLIGTAYPLRGGIAHYVGLLWKYLSRSHDVDVVTFQRQYPGFLFPGKSQEETGDAGIGLKSHVWIDSINPFNWMRVGFNIRKMKADLLVFKFWMPFFAPCYGVIAVIVRWKRKTKIIFIDDNVIPHEQRTGDKIFTKFAFRFVDGHVVQSHAVEQDLLRWKPSAKWKHLPHPVYEIFGEEILRTDARCQLNALSPSLQLSDEDLVLLFFGYIRDYKGLRVLLDAMPLILQKTKVKLLVVGEFYGDEEKYHAKVHELKLENDIFFYAEYVPNELVGMFFSAADVLTLPYIAATQSGIIQIAYNFHRPVIATDVGGLAEVVVHEKTGYIIPPQRPDLLSSAVRKFFDEKKFSEFRANILEEKKKYSWEYMVSGIEEFYNELVQDDSK